MSGKKKNSFNMACNLLSQMVKGQRSFVSDKLGLRPTVPTTLSLFPGADVSADDDQAETDSGCTEREKSPLTIFYNGKVHVFDDFSGEKAMDLMQLATNGNRVGVSTVVTGSCPTTLGSLPSVRLNQPSSPGLLAQTRRASLQRFLKKRKERINAKAPYQVKSSEKMGLV